MNKEEYHVKRFLDFPPSAIAFEEIEWAKYYIRKLQQENQQLIEKYNKRSKKWEKWETEKSILSTRMSEYLCKYQNIKREYTNQIANATKKKKEIEKLHNKIDKAIEILKLCNSKCAKETIEILKDSDVDENR